MSLDDYELNWTALKVAVIAPREISISQILMMAGLIENQSGERMCIIAKKKQYAEIVRLCSKGMTVKEIMTELGIDRQRVYNALHDSGIYLRKR